ncbi:MAG: DUF1292 domain-containing protein [Candidatus Sericytochromatia bacterium]
MDYSNDDTAKIITIIDKKGNIKKFQIIDQISIDNKSYIVALPYNNGLLEEKIVFIYKNEDEEFDLVEDEEEKIKINEYLTNNNNSNDVDFITFITDKGEAIEYEILDEIEFKGKKYFLAIKKDEPIDSDDYTIFEMSDGYIKEVEDENLIEEIMDELSENEFYDLDDSQITLKDGNNILDFNIIGKIDIYGQNYLISAPYNEEEGELVAILLENNKIVSYIKNHLISEDVRFFLSKISDYLHKNQHKSKFFEEN